MAGCAQGLYGFVIRLESSFGIMECSVSLVRPRAQHYVISCSIKDAAEEALSEHNNTQMQPVNRAASGMFSDISLRQVFFHAPYLETRV